MKFSCFYGDSLNALRSFEHPKGRTLGQHTIQTSAASLWRLHSFIGVEGPANMAPASLAVVGLALADINFRGLDRGH